MKSILIVDDEKVMLEVLRRTLTQLGYRIALSDSWKSALDLFSREKFDLVLVDVLMPHMNGFMIANRMRQLEPDQKIVMLTGLGADTAMAYNHSTRVHVNDVLLKPFTFEKLKSVITKALSRNKS